MSLNEIGALTYEGSVARCSDYNFGDEAEILDECVAALA